MYKFASCCRLVRVSGASAYTEPEIDKFEQAVPEFQERVPELAKGLVAG
jgi:hypothetical protein